MDNDTLTIQLLRGILEVETEILNAIKCPGVLSTKQTASVLRTSGARIDELRRSGDLVGVKVGKGYVFTANEILNYLVRREKEERDEL